jgi:hypothetical protein
MMSPRSTIFYAALFASARAFLPVNLLFPRQQVHWVKVSSSTTTPACNLEEADDDAASVVLRSTLTGRTIECYLHSHAKIEGDPCEYVVAVPCDPCVEICAVSKKTDDLTTIDEEDKKMDILFPLAAKVLEKEDLVLVRSATTLTLQGDLETDEDDETEVLFTLRFAKWKVRR